MSEPDPFDPRNHIERWGDAFYKGTMSLAELAAEALKTAVLWRHWANRR